MRRRQAEQIRLDCQGIIVGQIGKAVIGKGGVEVLAVGVNALMDGTQEVRVAPVANSGLFV